MKKNQEKIMVKSGVKSVLNLPAQTTIQCAPGKVDGKDIGNYCDCLDLVKNEPMYIQCIVEMMENGALRISEVLNVKGTDIMPNGKVIIKGAKGSNDRIVQVFKTRKWLLNRLGNSSLVFNNVDRFFVYRVFKRVGIGKRFDGKSKDSVTHYFRQSESRMLQDNGVGDGLRSSHLGHKSKSAIKHYSNGSK